MRNTWEKTILVLTEVAIINMPLDRKKKKKGRNKTRLPTKCSRQSSIATNGGAFRLEIAGRSLSPAFSVIRGATLMPSSKPPPPKTPTAVCIVLQSTCSVNDNSDVLNRIANN